MGPKVKFSRDDLIEAALDIIKRKGVRELTARGIAEQLGSSTAPVYSNFETMKNLELAAIEKVKDLLLDYTSRPYTDHVFLNMGIGLATFARDHSEFYRTIFLEGARYRELIIKTGEAMKIEMTKDIKLQSLPAEVLDMLLFRMRTFTHGLATYLSAGLSPDKSDRFIKETLLGVGSIVVEATIKQWNEQPNQGNQDLSQDEECC